MEAFVFLIIDTFKDLYNYLMNVEILKNGHEVKEDGEKNCKSGRQTMTVKSEEGGKEKWLILENL